MAVEMLVGLNVIDDTAYQAYRDEMSPLLEAHGGGFGYDFRVSEVLLSVTDAPINRVFTIFFASDAARQAFFSNTDYLSIKRNYFDKSVSDTTVIATYENQMK